MRQTVLTILVVFIIEALVLAQQEPVPQQTTAPAAATTNQSVAKPQTEEDFQNRLKSVVNKTAEEENLGYTVPDPISLNMDPSKGGSVETADLPTAEAPIPKVEVIVDSSGSMGQTLGDIKTKMFFLKKMLLRYFTDQWKEKALTGLRVYGANKKGQCDDNQLAVGFAESNLGKIESSVLKLWPLGMTPLFKSVQFASKDLESYKGPKRIIVFTDGEDTCGGDPCKVSAELTKRPDLDVKIYVVAIGFNPEDANFKKVSCLGDTQTANNEEELFSAMGAISNSINKNRINLKVISPDPSATVHLSVRQPDGSFKYFRAFTASWGATVPPGTYQAVVQLNPVYKFSTFTIPPKKVVTLKVGGEGKVRVNFVDSILNVDVLDKNRKVVRKFKSDQIKDVPIGRWSLRIYQEPFYDNFVKKFDVFPNGFHEYTVVGAGAVMVNTPNLQGVYVYDNKKRLMGHFVTKVPMALPSMEYVVHVDEKCSKEGVSIIDRQVKTIDCK